MARTVIPLTDSKCEAAKPREKDYKLFDGQGLYLLVRATGSKVWRLKYNRPNGKENTLTLGEYGRAGISLAKARVKRDEARGLLARGVDPAEHANQAKIEALNTQANTFETVALEWHASSSRRWSAGHANTVLRRMQTYLFPAFGSRPVAELKPRDLVPPLKLVEKRGSLALANRLRNCETDVLRYAVQHGYIEHNPARELVGVTAPNKSKHRPALPLHRLPELLQRVDVDSGRPLTLLAMKIFLLVFIRSSELRFARWSEVDFDRAMWVIPGERQPIEGVKYSHRGAKMGTPHLVPLSRQALALLEQVRNLTGRFDLIFIGDHHHWKPMSDGTVNKALRRMGYDSEVDVCLHGFRTMACSALSESGLWTLDAVERQMSHQERNSVRLAYIHKAKHIEERQLMVQWWADYLDANRERHVTPYEFARRGIAVEPKAVEAV